MVDACTNTAVRRTSRRLSNLYDDAFEAVGLKATQVSMLVEVDHLINLHGGAPTLQDLALNSPRTDARTPRVRDGLIELRQDQQYGRTKRAALTTAGAACLKRQAYAGR